MQGEGHTFSDQGEGLDWDLSQAEGAGAGPHSSAMMRAVSGATPGPEEFLERHITQRRRLSKYDRPTGDERWPEHLGLPSYALEPVGETQDLQYKLDRVTNWLQDLSGRLDPEERRRTQRLLRDVLGGGAHDTSARRESGGLALQEHGMAAAQATAEAAEALARARAQLEIEAEAEARARAQREREDEGEEREDEGGAGGDGAGGDGADGGEDAAAAAAARAAADVAGAEAAAAAAAREAARAAARAAAAAQAAERARVAAGRGRGIGRGARPPAPAPAPADWGPGRLPAHLRGVEMRNTYKFKAKFSGDPSDFPTFLVHLQAYMMDMGFTFQDDAERVRFVGQALEGKAAKWFVDLYRYHPQATRDYNHFMRALRQMYVEPFERETAEKKLRAHRQGKLSVVEYAREFKELASSVPDWTEPQRVLAFVGGLNPTLADKCLLLEDPLTVEGWVQLAGEMENRLERASMVQALAGKTMAKTSTPVKTKPRTKLEPAERTRRMEKGLCLGCGQAGHFLAHCPTKAASTAKAASSAPSKATPAKKTTTKKSTKSLLVPVAAVPAVDDSEEGSGLEDEDQAEEQSGNEDGLL
ncbi:uncharacterized protein LOC143838739 [Paroedura picta]|uniref:uncharacterized protein LOC143838739 n=1 Tax=Paroedura picta TaxID=143630 RepID=UPI004056E753